VSQGPDLVLPAGGGTLEIGHDSGLVLIWMDQAGNEAQGLWPGSPAPAGPLPLSPPATRKLQGAGEVFQIQTGTPVLLHVRMASPSVSLVKKGSEQPEVEVHPDRTSIDVYLPSGNSQIGLRPAGTGQFSDSVEFTLSSVEPTGEGLGPEVLLAPGSSRIFSFEVKQAGPVGIGVHASSDIVESELLSSKGEKLGTGTVQIVNLKPGIYLLAIRAPVNGVPVRARPAVVGIVPPSTDPPAEVVRKYMEPEEAPPQFTSRRGRRAEEVGNEETGESEEGTIGDEESESPDQ
jgi:hypothetical protein